ncbi:hypothetical protein PG984_011258 [Apiospora sp. TS-2023a]
MLNPPTAFSITSVYQTSIDVYPMTNNDDRKGPIALPITDSVKASVALPSAFRVVNVLIDNLSTLMVNGSSRVVSA